ncbi:MAG: acyl-CoA thioesterase [Paracoccaceae bacterium]
MQAQITHSTKIQVTFGDCDPAGIVYYPNNYRWFDFTFHDWLRTMGGHAALCRTLGAVGIGLMDSGARFRAPIRDGDLLQIDMRIEDWGPKALRLGYTSRVGDTVVVSGFELRGLFVPSPRGISGGDMATFRTLIGL